MNLARGEVRNINTKPHSLIIGLTLTGTQLEMKEHKTVDDVHKGQLEAERVKCWEIKHYKSRSFLLKNSNY